MQIHDYLMLDASLMRFASIELNGILHAAGFRILELTR